MIITSEDFNKKVLDRWLGWQLDALFIALFVFVSIAYDYHNLMTERPFGIHAWRQTDCASLALNYHQDDVSFLRPQMHFRLNEKGEAIGEFPLLYFLVGKLYDVFGFHEFIYRFLWFSFAFFGSFLLYRSSLKFTGLKLESLLIGLVLMLSPVVGIYSLSFIPDTTALFITAISVYCLTMSYLKKNDYFFYSGILFLSLAGLLKISSLLIPLSLLGVILLRYLTERNVIRAGKVFVGFMLMGLIIYSWYGYANEVNTTLGTNYFFMRLAPYWELTSEEIQQVSDILKNERRDQFYSWSILIFSVLLYLSSIFGGKKNNWNIAFIGISLVGIVVFAYLFFPQFRYHDYYMINLVLIVPAFLMAALIQLKDTHIYKRFSLIIQFLFIFAMFAGFLNSRRMVYDRNTNDVYKSHKIRGYNDLETYLIKLGISRDDLLISLPDQSPNTTLYLMNRKGWTNLYRDEITTADIEFMKEEGARFLLVGEEELLKDSVIMNYTDRPIGKYKDISIFKL